MEAYIDFFLITFLPALKQRFLELFLAPLNHPRMMWIIIPLITTVFLIQLYFGRYTREELGYHAALENTIYLLFVAVDLIRYVVIETKSVTTVKIFLISFLIAYAVLIGALNFFHKLPRTLAFRFSSKAFIGFSAYICVIVVYSEILNDTSYLSLVTTSLSIAVLWIMYSALLKLIQFFEPKSVDEVDDLLHDVEDDLRKAAHEIREN